MPDLSVLIPARNEMWLAQTIADALAHSEADTEVIAVLDGAPAVTPLPEDERVRVVELPASIGQRAATNLAAQMSTARYVMKLDAHCALGQGFDRIMIEDMQPEYTMVPTMYNLHVFDWVCQQCGHRRYQSPSGPCEQCGGPTERELVWQPRRRPETTAMRFDRSLKFQYWSAYKSRQGDGPLVETMSLLGACWLLERERYWELTMCDEGHGSWGQQGTEVACRTWLSGGRLVVNRRTWFSHLFRTAGGDFGFPYHITNSDVQHARDYSQALWRADAPDELPAWDKALHPLSWLIQRFAPVPDWDDVPVREPSKGIVYYTDSRLDPLIMQACQRQIAAGGNGHDLVSVSLQPLGFGRNITHEGERGVLTMHRQILAGLEASTADVVFLCEHDVLYHPSHFEFVPPRRDTFYFNTNVWRARWPDGHCVWTDDLQQTSGVCAYRELLLDFYRRRVAQIERDGFNRHYEPGPKQTVGGRLVANWQSARPNLDIRHAQTLSRSKWAPSEFRNPQYARGWREAGVVDGWGQVEGRLPEILAEIGG